MSAPVVRYAAYSYPFRNRCKDGRPGILRLLKSMVLTFGNVKGSLSIAVWEYAIQSTNVNTGKASSSQQISQKVKRQHR